MSVFFRLHQDQRIETMPDQLYVKEMRVGQKFDLPSFLLLANNHLDEATARDDETLGLFICNY